MESWELQHSPKQMKQMGPANIKEYNPKETQDGSIQPIQGN